MIGDAGLEMQARFEVAGQQLVLEYEVRNRGSRDVYLLNRLYRSTPAWQLGPDVVYVELVPGTRTVRLLKKLADLPSGVDVTAPVAPFVTPLRAGGTFRETVRVPLPVREHREYSGRGPARAGEPPNKWAVARPCRDRRVASLVSPRCSRWTRSAVSK